MRNAGYGDEKSRRIPHRESYRHGNFDGSRWSIIKVARTAFPFYGKSVVEAPAKTARSCGTARCERRDFALAFNNAGVMGTRSRVVQPLPLSTVIMPRGTRYLRNVLRVLHRKRSLVRVIADP